MSKENDFLESVELTLNKPDIIEILIQYNLTTPESLLKPNDPITSLSKVLAEQPELASSAITYANAIIALARLQLNQ